jgi:hypothetical protein
MRLSAALVVVALAAAPATAEVVVRVSGGRVDLTATAAPLADVLDRLARQTGMKVVYEGAAPRQLVTLSLHGRTPAETVLSVFEGLGVNFALVADPSGSRVQTLVVAGTATASSPASSAAAGRSPSPPSARRPFGPPPGASPETAEPSFQEPDEEPTPGEEAFAGLPPGAEVGDPGGATPPDPTTAAPRLPFVPPGASPGFSPSPFMPQPQPFPPAVAVPAAPGANPPPEEGAAPTNPPPP